MTEADYQIKAKPIDNKSWNEANRIEVVLNLETETETKSFKGIAELFGIIKK